MIQDIMTDVVRTFIRYIQERKSFQYIFQKLEDIKENNSLSSLKNYIGREGQNIADIALSFQNFEALRALAEFQIDLTRGRAFSNIILHSPHARRGFQSLQYGLRNNFYSSSMSCVVVGQTGTGKTSLINQLCGSSRFTEQGGKSASRDLQQLQVRHGNENYTLIDTPGVNSTEQVYLHAYLLFQGLTAKKHNAILVVIQFQKRIQSMTQKYNRIIYPFQKYEQNVIVMVSFFDNAVNKQEMKRQITQAFRQQVGIESDIIFFSNLQAQQSKNHKYADYLADLIYKCASHLSPIQIKLTKEEFFSSFKLFNPNGTLSVLLQKFQVQSSNLLKDYENMATIAQDDQDPQGVYNFLITSFRGEINGYQNINLGINYQGLIQKYLKKAIQHNIDSLEEYTVKIQLVKSGIKLLQTYRSRIQVFLSNKLINSTSIRHLIRKCPHCGRIWVKSTGCSGSTSCGNRDFAKEKNGKFGFDYEGKSNEEIERSSQSIWGYKIVFKNGKRQVVKTQKRISQKNVQNFSKDLRIKGKGCGKQFEWRSAPLVDQKQILQLFATDSIQRVKAMIISDNKEDKLKDMEEKFGQKVRQYEEQNKSRIKLKSNVRN